MKIAVISDIHSNLNALEKVVDTINTLECDIKICLGDIVGYYDKPNEVIECLRQNDFICIKGNHDKFILGEIDYSKKNEKIYGVNRHRGTLTNENYLFLKECLEYFEYSYKDKTYCFCHSLINDCQFYLKSKEDILNKFDIIKKYDYYFYGHTHRKNSLIVDKCIIINPGSVGQQRGDDWRPSFCVVDLDKDNWKLINVKYDIKAYVQSLIDKGYNQILIDILQKY